MAIDKKTWSTIIVTAIIVAVLASLITANITGNVIKAQGGGRWPVYLTNETYNKTEIDNKLSSIYSNEVIDYMFYLFDCYGRQMVRLSEGGSQTVTVAFGSHTINLKGATSTTAATIIVDGVQKSVTKGNTYNFRGGLSIYVKRVLYSTLVGTPSKIELLVGTNECNPPDGEGIFKTNALSVNSAVISGLSANNLSSGNAYACIDSTGKIYRSLSACR